MSRDCGSGYEYSAFFTGWGPNSNNCIGNRDSLNFLNLQVQDLDRGSGSDCIVFFIRRLCYSLQGFFIVCGPNSIICLGNRDSLKFLNQQAQDLDCGSGSDYIVFFIPRLRYFLKVQLDLYCGSGGEHVVFSIPKTCFFLKVQRARDRGSSSEYSVFFIGCGPSSNMCLGNKDSMKDCSLGNVHYSNAGTTRHTVI